MVEYPPSKRTTRVRFPASASSIDAIVSFFLFSKGKVEVGERGEMENTPHESERNQGKGDREREKNRR